MSGFVVDADVAIKWHVEQPDSGQAEHVLQSGEKLHAPKFQDLEVRQVLSKYVRMRLLDPLKARHAAEAHGRMIDFWHGHDALIDDAFDLSLTHAHPFYDCLYVALALRLNARLITADRKLVSKFAQGAHAGRVVLLGDYAAL